MNKALNQYLATALWSSGIELDEHHNENDIAESSIEKAAIELNQFIEQAGSLLDGIDLDQAAHDFWLTRNRHGAGFWDGDYPKEISEKLTNLAHSFGESNLYMGDDGKVHIY